MSLILPFVRPCLFAALMVPALAQSTWQDISGNVPGAFTGTNNIGPILAHGEEIYLLGSAGIYRSSDGGDSFSALNTVSGTSSYDLSITALTFVEAAGDYIYVGRDPGSHAANSGYTPMHRISPGGTQWTQASQTFLPDTATGDSVEGMAHDATTGIYYASSRYAGCYVSNDGLTWTGKRNGLPATNQSGYTLVLGDTVTAHEGKAYVSILSPSATGGVYVTEDQGENWNLVPGSPKGQHGNLKMHGDRLLISSSGPSAAEHGTYYKDPGQDFRIIKKFLGEHFDIRSNGSHLFAGYKKKFYFSSTQGITWDEIDTTGISTAFEARRLEASDDTLYLVGNINGTPTLYRRALSSIDLTPTTKIAVEPFPPVDPFVWGPQPPRYANAGTVHSFTALAAGSNISYQWKFNGSPIPGATAATLDFTLSSSGTLSLEVTGDKGTANAENPVVFSVVPSEPGFADTTFQETTPTLNGYTSIAAYPDGRVAAVLPPKAYLFDSQGIRQAERATIGDSMLRHCFLDAAGRLVVWGDYSLMRLDKDTLADDAGFSPVTFTRDASPGAQTPRINHVVELPGQGYLTATNDQTLHNGQALPAVALFDYTGARVTGFTNPFVNFSPSFAPKASRLGITPEGKILVEIATAKWAGATSISVGPLARLHADGTRDPDFAIRDDIPISFRTIIRKFRVQPDGKILYGTNTDARTPKRLNADGTYDAGFNVADVAFDGNIHGFLPQSSMAILVYGAFEDFGRDAAFGHLRLTGAGTPDPGYDSAAGFKNINTDKAITDAALTADGNKVFFVPEAGDFRGTTHSGIVRVFADHGSADPFESYLIAAGVPVQLRGPDADADGDGFANLLEFAYGTHPANNAIMPAPSGSDGILSGAAINAISPAAGLSPSAQHYVTWIRLPKDSQGVTLVIEAGTELTNLGDGSATLVPHGSPVDEGSTLLQAYHLLQDTSMVPAAFWRIRALQN